MDQSQTHQNRSNPEIKHSENNPWFNLAKPLMGVTDVFLGNVDVYKLKEENEHYKILVDNLRKNLEIETKNVEKIILENIKITDEDKARRMNQLEALRRADQVFLQQYNKHGILQMLSGKPPPKPPDVPDDLFDFKLPDRYHQVVAIAKARNLHAFTPQDPHPSKEHNPAPTPEKSVSLSVSPKFMASLLHERNKIQANQT